MVSYEEAIKYKDAEITALRQHEKYLMNEQNRLKDAVYEAKAEPHYPDGPWDRLHKANAEIADLVHANGILREWRDNQIKHIAQLEDRIAQQDQELKDLGKALEKVRDKVLDELIERTRTGYLLKCSDLKSLKTPRKEPEMVICPYANVCKGAHCPHRIPHKHGSDCDLPSDTKCHICDNCIPYKKEPTVPEVQQQICRENTVAGALHYDIEVQGRRIDAYAKKQVGFDERLEALETALKSLKEEIASLEKKVK